MNIRLFVGIWRKNLTFEIDKALLQQFSQIDLSQFCMKIFEYEAFRQRLKKKYFILFGETRFYLTITTFTQKFITAFFKNNLFRLFYYNFWNIRLFVGIWRKNIAEILFYLTITIWGFSSPSQKKNYILFKEFKFFVAQLS